MITCRRAWLRHTRQQSRVMRGRSLGATVIRVDKPTLLEYTWGDDVLRWELVATAVRTRLTLAATP